MVHTIGKAVIRILWVLFFITMFIVAQHHQRSQVTWGPTNVVQG